MLIVMKHRDIIFDTLTSYWRMQSQGIDATETKILTNDTPILVMTRGIFECFHKRCVAIVNPVGMRCFSQVIRESKARYGPLHCMGTIVQHNFDCGPREPCDGRISECSLEGIFHPRFRIWVWNARVNFCRRENMTDM